MAGVVEIRTTESIWTEIRLSCREKFCPIWLKALFRDGSSMSCAFASLQLRQGGARMPVR